MKPHTFKTFSGIHFSILRALTKFFLVQHFVCVFILCRHIIDFSLFIFVFTFVAKPSLPPGVLPLNTLYGMQQAGLIHAYVSNDCILLLFTVELSL